jgi:hypothetical protein
MGRWLGDVHRRLGVSNDKNCDVITLRTFKSSSEAARARRFNASQMHHGFTLRAGSQVMVDEESDARWPMGQPIW